MGMLSRAMKSRKKEMLDELENETALKSSTNLEVIKVISLPNDLATTLAEMSAIRGIGVEQLIFTHMISICNAYQNQKVLNLNSVMPYGKYRGVLIEDMIRSDPRYVNWLASESEIFVLDEGTTQLLVSLS